MDRLEWLRERQRGISASDAADLVGVGYGDALRVYNSKVNPPSAEVPVSGPLARGLALEDVVAGIYEREMGEPLSAPAIPISRHPVNEWQSASPDRVRRDGRYVQIKTVAGFGVGWGAAGSDRVPDGYTLQVQQEMACTGTESIDLAALDVFGWELRVYRIAFDPQLWAWLTQVERRFWHEHVLPRVPPPDGWGEQHTREAVAHITKGMRVELDPGVVDLIERRKELGAVRDEADEEYRAISQQLTQLMGDAEEAVAGAWRLRRTTIAGGEYTAKRSPYVRLDVRRVKS